MQSVIRLPTAVILMFTCTVIKDVSSINDTDNQRLLKTLFANYDKTIRPILNTADVTNVTLNPALFSIINTNEADGSITIVLWFRMTWIDAFIQWNPEDYGGMQQLLIPISRIWYPNIYALNMVRMELPIPEEKNYAIISYDGTVVMSIDQVLTLHCNYDITMFPFDIQNCTMSLDSWMYTDDQLDLSFNTPTDLHSYNQNNEWDLISMRARGSKLLTGISTTPFAIVYYDIVIQRYPSYYLLTFVLPCFMITTISIIGIFAPFNDSGDREEKVTMGLTTLLTMTLVVTLIAAEMPKSSNGLPLLGTYIMLQVGIAASNSLMTVIIMYQQRKWTSGQPVPTWILTVTRLTCKKATPSPNEAKIADFSAQWSKLDQISSSPNRASINAIRQESILKHIQLMVWQILLRLSEQNDEENLRREWQQTCQSLDLLLMFTFLAINCVLTGGILAIGYLHLQK